MTMLSNVEVWAPVTAVHVCQDYLFVGISNKLEIYQIQQSSISSPIHTQWENCWKIHGFCSKIDDQLLRFAAFGNRFVSLNVLNIEKNDTKHSRNVYIGDWIQTADFFDSNCLAVITSHNKLILLNCDTGKVIREVLGPTKGVLYSSVIIQMDPPQRITVACGTVFNNIVMWEHEEGSEPLSIDNKSAHSGAIYALEYSEKNKILYSASDDRFIGIWGVLERDGKAKGFCFKSKVNAHEARIWKLLSIGKNLISCGENDLCIWTADGRLLSRRNSEKSGIWSLAGSESEAVVFAGTNNGSILIVPLEEKLISCTQGLLKKPREHNLPNHQTVCKIEEPRYIILHPDHVIVIYKLGSIELFALDGQSLVKKGSGRLKLDSDEEWCLTHDSERLYVLSGEKLYSMPISLDQSFEFDVEMKIIAEKEESYSFTLIGDYLFIGVAGYRRKRTLVLTVNEKLSEKTNLENGEKFPIYMSFDTDKIDISLALCGLAIRNQFIIGCRTGLLSQIKFKQPDGIECIRKMSAHPPLGVNCLEAKPFSPTFYSCGRDLLVNEYTFVEDTEYFILLRQVTLDYSHDWVERIFFDTTTDCLNIIGHSPRKLSLWREKDRSILWELKVDDRLWNLSTDKNKLQLAFVRKGSLFFYSKSLNPLVYNCARIRPKFHSAKVNCAVLLCLRGSKAYIASAGEDNRIVIEEFDAKERELKFKKTLHGHISSIRSLATHEEEGKIYLISGGGRSQLIVWAFQIGQNGDISARKVDEHLNWTDEVCNRTHWRDFCTQNETQARYLACNIARKNDSLRIAICCSDGFLRIFMFNLNSKKLSLKGEKQVSDFCPLSVLKLDDFFAVGSNDGTISFWRIQTIEPQVSEAPEKNNLLKATPSKLLDQVSIEMIHSEKFHQSGVNCLRATQHDNGTWLLFSGGDDGTLHGAVINLNCEKFELHRDTSITSAHDSQISSVNFVNSDTLVTVSVNEWITLWKIDCSLNELVCKETELAVEKQFSLISSVADAASSILLNFVDLDETYLLLAGEGFQVVKINQ
ncbi:tRNA (34-2'-O)-methyltransferase regulator WDR6 [Brevipalpus obovatus]|uniref:tRNA (34-2'-O)-methyltransferase regulator WDR6 n=1 Tax=Brevipalpus obovatus TaxID=246614 RepID=UPI003D9EC70F